MTGQDVHQLVPVPVTPFRGCDGHGPSNGPPPVVPPHGGIHHPGTGMCYHD